jgi:uncharacterized protein (TIGR02231 family)
MDFVCCPHLLAVMKISSLANAYLMKTLIVLLFVMLPFAETLAQQDKKVESAISNVTVFLNRAQITRKVKMKVEPGKTNLVVSGLTSQLDQQSIQVAGKGSFIILGIAHQQNFLNEFNIPKSLQVLRDSLELLQRQLTIENSQKEILNKEEQMLLLNQKVGGTNQNVTVAELKAMADFFRTRLGEIVVAKVRVEEKIKRLNERITRLQKQVNEKNEMLNRNTSEIVISISAEASTAAELEVSYVIANAGWYPLYDLRAAGTKSPVQLSYKANVYQNTGEEWHNVRLKLSTANPSLGGMKPELSSWYLNFYQPMERQLRGRVAGVRSTAPSAEDKSEELAEGVPMSEPSESTADFVTTIQTSLNTEFDISLPYSVPSSSKPTLVDIANHELKASYVYSSAPKLDGDAFLIAKATGWEQLSLLPGEASVFFEGTFVTKTYIDPASIKDTLSLSLGRDKRIVVKREKLKDFSSKKLIGTNQRSSYAYEITIKNTKAEPVTIIVEDQMPVSQNSQIEVTVIDTGGSRYNKDTGKLTWELGLQPNETKKVSYKFEVKFPKDRLVAGLE